MSVRLIVICWLLTFPQKRKRWRRTLGPYWDSTLAVHIFQEALWFCPHSPMVSGGTRVWLYKTDWSGLSISKAREAIIHDWVRPFRGLPAFKSPTFCKQPPTKVCKWPHVIYWFSKIRLCWNGIMISLWYKEGVDIYLHYLRQRVPATP